MISFTILTDTPARLRTQLITAGILQNVAGVVPARDGFVYTANAIPNPIVTTQAVGNPGDGGYVPPVYDARKAYLVKMARAAEDDECNGEARDARSLLLRTKFGKWVMANSTSDPIVGWHNGAPVSYPARKINAAAVWLTLATLGEWQ